MGVYTYVTKPSIYLNVTLPTGESVKAYKMEWFCLARDIGEFGVIGGNRGIRLEQRLQRLDKKWRESGIEELYIVYYDKLYRWTSSQPPIWDDCNPFPAEYIGGLIKKNNRWIIDPTIDENS